MPLKTTYLNFKRKSPIIICATDKSGFPIKDPKSLSKLELAETNRTRVQINYFGPYTMLYRKSLDSHRFRCLEDSLFEFEKLNLPVKKIHTSYDGNPLVLFRQDETGKVLHNNVFSLISFGERINPNSNEPVSISYQGPLVFLTYEDALRLNEDVCYRVLSAKDILNKILEKRENVENNRSLKNETY